MFHMLDTSDSSGVILVLIFETNRLGQYDEGPVCVCVCVCVGGVGVGAEGGAGRKGTYHQKG